MLSPRGQNAVRVSNLDALILDEADRLLSAPDHRRDVERIMRHLPKQRRTHLFSATMTDAVEDLVGVGLRNPVRIVVNLKDKRGGEVSERRVPMGLQNTYLLCGQADKTLQLIRVLQQEAREHEAAKMIVYFSTGAAVDYFYRVRTTPPRALTADPPPPTRNAKFPPHLFAWRPSPSSARTSADELHIPFIFPSRTCSPLLHRSCCPRGRFCGHRRSDPIRCPDRPKNLLSSCGTNSPRWAKWTRNPPPLARKGGAIHRFPSCSEDPTGPTAIPGQGRTYRPYIAC